MNMENLTIAVQEVFSNYIVQIVLIILAVLVAHAVSRPLISLLVHKLTPRHKFRSSLDEEKRERTLTSIFHTVFLVTIWLTGVLLVLLQLNINVTALIASAGALGLVIGIGAQSAIKDFVGGFFIIFENQYRVEDIVSLTIDGGETAGLVEDMTIRITKLRDLDGNLHIIPNGSIKAVTNLSFDHANVNIDLDVSYDSDIDRVIEVINQVGNDMAHDTELSESIIEPIQFLRIDGFEDSGIRIKSLGKVEPAKQWDVAGDFRRRILFAFRENGISIPYPQMVVHKTKE